MTMHNGAVPNDAGLMPQPTPQHMPAQATAPYYGNNGPAPQPVVMAQPVMAQPVVMAQPQPMIINNAAPPSNTVTNNTIVVGNMGNGKSEKNKLVLIPMDKLQSRSWGTGLCGCLMDITGCFCGMFLLPCLACRVANRMGECALVPFFGGAVAMRTKLRTMGGIKGTIHSDCIVSYCCYACAMCQMEREINAMKL